MKYGIQYHRDFRYLDSVAEVIIVYDKFKIGLLDFLKTREDEQRIVVDAGGVDYESMDYDIIIAAKQIHPNLTIKVDSGIESAILDRFKEAELDFFFCNFIDTWDKLISVIKTGVSDVYITNELGFELDEVSLICKENNVKVRVFANVAQTSSHMKNLDTIKFFYIRPEDVFIYDDYVDVIEFFGPKTRQSVLYDIYTNGRWLGDLKDLILGLDVSAYSKHIVPYFGSRRVRCRKQCNQNQCCLCDGILELAKELQEKGIEIGIEREREKVDESELNEQIMQIKRTSTSQVFEGAVDGVLSDGEDSMH